MKINSTDIIAINAKEYFEKYIASTIGLRPIFEIQREWCKAHTKYIHNKDGSIIVEFIEPEIKIEYPSHQEVGEYVRKRNEYIADAILKHCGWEAFLKRCNLYHIEDYIQKRVPCESYTKQCMLDCPKFIECHTIEKIIPWDNKEVYDGKRRYI